MIMSSVKRSMSLFRDRACGYQRKIPGQAAHRYSTLFFDRGRQDVLKIYASRFQVSGDQFAPAVVEGPVDDHEDGLKFSFPALAIIASFHRSWDHRAEKRRRAIEKRLW